MRAQVLELWEEGWEFTLSTQTNWRVQSKNDYYYLRCPKTKVLIRVTWERNRESTYFMSADFMLPEKVLGAHRRKFQSEEALIKNQEREDSDGMAYQIVRIARDDPGALLHIAGFREKLLEDLTINELLDAVIKKQPKIKRKFAPKPTAKIIDFEQYLQKILTEGGNNADTSEKRA